ncbi:preprotein translocase subunit SecA [Magnetococcus sp. PR-3]|uniref:preprotein translocase subunit SecA n=1 Tax=Magnetococcus sp. PR-3 TaxID=3120355 RepID=UPI002FCDE7C5
MNGYWALAEPSPLPKGVEGWLHSMHGVWRSRPQLKGQLRRMAHTCLQRCNALADLDDATLQAQLVTTRIAFRLQSPMTGEALIDGLAQVGEMAWRHLGKRPYLVQFMGALALYRGWLAEMSTGEGKTLTVGLAAVLAGWEGRPCHVISANDYLTERDAEQMQPLLEACGLTVASAGGELSPEERQVRYEADVAYVTAKTLLADHLRDQLADGKGVGRDKMAFQRWYRHDLGESLPNTLMLPRGLHSAIIDEADSVLIDEAVTPLILSAPQEVEGLHDAVKWAEEVAEGLREEEDYQLDIRHRQVTFLSTAMEMMEAMAWRLAPVWRSAVRRQALVRNALSVRHFFQPGRHYLVDEEKVVLLDDATGRMTPERSLSAGLHQAIEAYEGLPLTDPNASMGQMSFQTFFRRFARLAGTTGTAAEAARELWNIYRLTVVSIPTHRPPQRQVAPPQIFSTAEAKWQKVVEEVARQHALGRPVLVGVRSVHTSEHLAQLLAEQALTAQVLNAQHHAQEADIVALAGQTGAITIATNMAGRGTDIALDDHSRSLGGLHVIIAECNDSARIDRQLVGRCGRQGDPGSAVSLLSMDEGVFKRQMGTLVRQSMRMMGRKAWKRGVQYVQSRAERMAFHQRRSVMEADVWLDSALPF